MAAPRPLITTDDLCRSEERKTDSAAPRTSRYCIELVASSVNMTHTHRSLGRLQRQLLCRLAFVPPCLMDVIFGGVWGAAPNRGPDAERRDRGPRVRWRSRTNLSPGLPARDHGQFMPTYMVRSMSNECVMGLRTANIMRLRHRTRGPRSRRSASGPRVGAAPQTPPKITSIRQGGTKAGRHNSVALWLPASLTGLREGRSGW